MPTDWRIEDYNENKDKHEFVNAENSENLMIERTRKISLENSNPIQMNLNEEIQNSLENDTIHPLLINQTTSNSYKQISKIIQSQIKLPMVISKLSVREKNINPTTSKKKEKDRSFLTPMLLRYNSENKTDIEPLKKTQWKSDQKTIINSHENSDFIKKYLASNGLSHGSLRDVFDVLRLENPEFRTIDNKIRTLLCLVKTLVIRAVVADKQDWRLTPLQSKQISDTIISLDWLIYLD